VATIAFPRAAWLGVAAATAFLLAVNHLTGAALAVALAMALPAALAPLAPRLWPLVAGAPLLAVVGLAGAWPAVAGRASTAWGRAMLGAVGWMWVLIAEELTGIRLAAGGLGHGPLPEAWTNSAPIAIRDVLLPALGSGAWWPALVWAAGATVLPWLVRGISTAFDVVRVTVWAAVIASATATALAAAPGLRHGPVRGSVAGAVVGALIALAPSLHAAARERMRAAGVGPGLP
jgi:hypothetical protein